MDSRTGLILTRKPGEDILIGDNIEIQFLNNRGPVTKVRILAPKEVHILRKELKRHDKEND